MNGTREDWMVIVNPNAGKGKGSKDWKRIAGLLARYGVRHSTFFTKARRHAIELTCNAIASGYRKFIVVGGDGTMNEVVNGVFTQQVCPTTDVSLSMISVGTGNDWGKLFGIPHNYEAAVEIIAAGKTRLQDAGKAEYFHGTHKEHRFFLNIAGLGFDAVVTRRTNIQKDKGRSGKVLYFYNLLKSLLVYRHTAVEVEIDDTRICQDVFTISIGIGRFSGGGMQQTPNAIPDDGLFDITIVKKIRKGEIILSLKKLYDGTILDHPKIEGYKGRVILIDSDPLIHLEADGESLGHSPIRFEIIPQSILILYGTYPE